MGVHISHAYIGLHGEWLLSVGWCGVDGVVEGWSEGGWRG